MNPYKNAAPFQYWSKAVTAPCFGDIDPVVNAGFRIGPDDKVATLGSCFAQHVARHIRRSGLTSFVPEDGTHLTLEDADRRNYGVFSARYGNVYTVRQALQLFDRAFGAFMPDDSWWALGDRFVDPFRPQVEPGGFATVADLESDRVAHLAAVRRVFIEARVIVFTLGLTEAWTAQADGAVFPLAPGVAGGSFDPMRYAFANFDTAEVTSDLISLCKKIHSINRSANVLLTVSPVPLIATFEGRHVLVSTVLSKSVLRVAAEQTVKELRHVHYFPSYEIITAPGSNYFEADLREVSDIGVGHVMRIFGKHYIGGSSKNARPNIMPAKPVVCDEESIDRARSL